MKTNDCNTCGRPKICYYCDDPWGSTTITGWPLLVIWIGAALAAWAFFVGAGVVALRLYNMLFGG